MRRESFQTMRRAKRVRRHYAYLLRCADGSYYAGYTAHPALRLLAHRRGRASRYTRGRGPHAFAAIYRCPTRRAAMRLERLLKRLSHTSKHRLVQGGSLRQVLASSHRLGARRLPRGRGALWAGGVC